MYRRMFLATLVAAAVVMPLTGCNAQRSAQLLATGDRHMRVGSHTDAVRDYQQAVKLNATDKGRLRLAAGMIKLGRYADALKLLNEVTDAPPGPVDYLTAVCRLGLNDVAAAHTAAETALQANPDDCLTLALLGRIRFLQGNYPQSITAYNRALTSASSERLRTRLHYNLAMAHLLAGQFTHADQAFNQYLARQKYVDATDKKMAGAIAYAVGDHARAYRYWQHLSEKEKQGIMNALADEDALYEKLAAAE